MKTTRSLLAIGALALAGSAYGETLSLDASTTMTRSSNVGGRTVAWRYVSVRAESSLFEIEAKMPSCADSAGDPTLAAGSVPAPCGSNSAGTPSGLPGQQLRATLKLPTLVANGPWVDISLRSFRSSTPGAEDRGSGTSTDVEIVQRYGPIDLIAGLSYPVRLGAVRDGWNVTFAGLAWRTAASGTLEFVAEQARAVASGTRDDRYTARYFHVMNRGARAALYVSRLASDPAERWRAGLNLEIAF